MLTTYKEAGRPLPRFSDDDFIDHCVLEATVLKKLKEDQKAQKDADRKRKVQEAKARLIKGN